MSNETKQTAVDWYAEKSIILFDNFQTGKINFKEWLKQYALLLGQAKEMEKEQCITFYVKGCIDTYGMDEGDDDRKDAETWYNETYGGNK
jgi:hypothetical protein